jgi:hypothetical protein
VKDSFFEETERVLNKFPKYHTNILLEELNVKVGKEDTFKPTIENESLHKISNDNGVRVINFGILKILTVKSTMLPHRNIHKFTVTSPDGKTHNQMDNILIHRRCHSCVLTIKLAIF